jgi:hypothetical protein
MDYQIDFTQVIIALIVVFGPALVRELHSFYSDWKAEQPDMAYRIEQAAEFGVKAAQTLKDNGLWDENKGARAEQHAINAAEAFLLKQGIHVNVGLILEAVRAAWQDSKFKSVG